ncbi:MAG: NnrS family protein [Deltaproteobacteria bacterium]|nr:NnrS family protein [Deltaproteobacteria bacterium]
MLLAYGFRVFFLLAALLGVSFVPIWPGVFAGHMRLATPLGPIGWHSHEMLFGFTVAVLAGFLLTAVRNWTQRMTAEGSLLGLLALLWLAGRVALLVPALPWQLVMAADLAFLPALAVVVARPIFGAKSRRNYAFPVLLLVLSGANALLHLAPHGIAPDFGRAAIYVALDAVLLIMAIVGGRIVPNFTANAIQGTYRQRGRIDQLALGGLTVLLVVDALPWLPTQVSAGVALVTGLFHLARMRGWNSWATRRVPLLAVLHAGYALVGLGLLLLGVARLWPRLPLTAATHVLTVGAIGGLTLGMMTRVALGHTGRPLVLPRSLVVAYLLVLLATIARALVSLWPARLYLVALTVPATLWGLAFLLYLVVYVPILVRPRADGKPG